MLRPEQALRRALGPTSPPAYSCSRLEFLSNCGSSSLPFMGTPCTGVSPVNWNLHRDGGGMVEGMQVFQCWWAQPLAGPMLSLLPSWPCQMTTIVAITPCVLVH